MKYYNIHSHIFLQDSEIITLIDYPITEYTSSPEYISLGIHPWTIKEETFNSQFKELNSFINKNDIIAIGEAGLDKNISTSMEIQQDIFVAQIRLSEELKKPLIIHCVKAWNELIRLHREMEPSQPWVIHGFRGKKELSRQLLDEGFFLSFGYYFNNEAVKEAWKENIFAETDDKEISIKDVYLRLAMALNISIEEFGLQIEKNVREVFPKLIKE